MLNAYSLTFGGLLLLGARSGDLFGRRRVFLAGIVVFTARLARSAASPRRPGCCSPPGRCRASARRSPSPSALALLMIMFREGAERTRAIALYTAVSIGGSAVGLIARWRAGRVGVLALGVLRQRPDRHRACSSLARRDLPETDRRAGRIDVPRRADLDDRHGRARLRLCTGGRNRVAGDQHDRCVHRRNRAARHLRALEIERQRRSPRCGCSPIATAAFSYLARLVMVGGMFGMFFFLTQFLQDVLRYSPLQRVWRSCR